MVTGRVSKGAINSAETVEQRDVTRVTLAELVALRRSVSAVKRPSGRRVQAPLLGGNSSRAMGRGLDFAEVREYHAGDDVRMIDWKVTARSGKPHTKIYNEERERPFLLVVDLRPSMFFATQVAFKSVLAARLGAMVAWAAASNRDRVGGLIFCDDHLCEIKPTTGSKGVAKLLREIVTAHSDVRGRLTRAPEGQPQRARYSFNDAMQRLQRIAHTGSSICLISDFTEFDPHDSGATVQLLRHNHIAACHLYDPLEATLPPPASYAISDGRRRGLFNTRSTRLRQEYAEAFAARSADINSLFSSQASACLELPVTGSLTHTAGRIMRALPGSM